MIRSILSRRKIARAWEKNNNSAKLQGLFPPAKVKGTTGGRGKRREIFRQGHNSRENVFAHEKKGKEKFRGRKFWWAANFAEEARS